MKHSEFEHLLGIMPMLFNIISKTKCIEIITMNANRYNSFFYKLEAFNAIVNFKTTIAPLIVYNKNGILLVFYYRD